MDDIRDSLATAPASDIVERLRHHLETACGATGFELLLVDYRLSRLLPLLAGEAHSPDGVQTSDDATAADPKRLGTVPGGAAWRAFDDQQPEADYDALYLPVTMRGERLGVLRLEPAAALLPHTTMLTGLARLLAHELTAARFTTDRYLIGARSKRLTLAAEMQWETLPGRSCVAAEFTLAGQLEPAYAVKGDTFDWAANVDRLSLSVIDGMGEGVAAAALSMLGTGALRNARRAGLGIAEQASMADDALYAHHRGAQYLSVLLLEIDLRTGRVKAIDTGSPVLMLVRADEISEIRLASHDPLGMFEGSHYASQEFQLEPGDRLLIVSDGIHAVTTSSGTGSPSRSGSGSGERRYGETDLRRLIRRTRGLPPLAVVRTVVNELQAFVAGELTDDAAAMCLDWRGPRSVR